MTSYCKLGDCDYIYSYDIYNSVAMSGSHACSLMHIHGYPQQGAQGTPLHFCLMSSSSFHVVEASTVLLR
jgi:hypothetical protein